MAYELFTNKAAKFGSPQLTIRGAKIAFNADAGDLLAGVGVRFAHILWDAAAHKIAIRPVVKEDTNTFRMAIPEGKRGGTLSAQSFLNFIQWHSDVPVVVDAHWNEKDRVLEATVPAQHVGSGEKRRKFRVL